MNILLISPPPSPDSIIHTYCFPHANICFGCYYRCSRPNLRWTYGKIELTHGKTYNTRQEGKTAIFEYIEVFYNRQRRHSYRGYLSPESFERKNVA